MSVYHMHAYYLYMSEESVGSLVNPMWVLEPESESSVSTSTLNQWAISSTFLLSS